MTLTVPVSDAVLARLRERAAELGTTPEAVAAADLSRAAAPIRPGSFLAKWAGAVRSDVPGWAEDHDRHLGEAQARDRKGQEDDGVR